MEQILGRAPVLLLSLASAVVAWYLRTQQLAAGEAGLGMFGWVCVGAVVLFALYSFFLRPRKDYGTMETRSKAVMGITMVSAVLMLVGCAGTMLALNQMTDVLVATGSAVIAICWGIVALDRVRGRRTPVGLYMIAALFFAAELICEFRFWSRDPEILDYCFDLLALICVMCATFHLGGFCFAQGKRRMTVFFCLCGVFFSAAALAGSGLNGIGRNGASVLWLFANLLPLLRPVKKARDED